MKEFLKRYMLPAILIAVVLGLASATTLWERNVKGNLQIRQSAVKGELSVRFKPGIYWQGAGIISTMGKGKTLYFTQGKDSPSDVVEDQSIEVRFYDGSRAWISGTLRMSMPKTTREVVYLVDGLGYKTAAEIETDLVIKSVRNALKLTAKFMTARESVSSGYIDYINWADDQIQNGLYSTTDVEKKEVDPITGELVTKTQKAIRKNADGSPIYNENALSETGLLISNFEIKRIIYDDPVVEQIAEQQAAYMAVETAIANAKKAEQDALTKELEGKADVIEQQYIYETKKIAAVVEAQQRRDVAQLDKEAAEYTKQKEILLGEGEATRKRLNMEADGALDPKLKALVQMNKDMADAIGSYTGAWTPSVLMGGAAEDGGPTTGAGSVTDMMKFITAKMAKDMSLDMTLPASKPAPKKQLVSKPKRGQIPQQNEL